MERQEGATQTMDRNPLDDCLSDYALIENPKDAKHRLSEVKPVSRNLSDQTKSLIEHALPDEG
jgi:hypothetical protein